MREQLDANRIQSHHLGHQKRRRRAGKGIEDAVIGTETEFPNESFDQRRRKSLPIFDPAMQCLGFVGLKTDQLPTEPVRFLQQMGIAVLQRLPGGFRTDAVVRERRVGQSDFRYSQAIGKKGELMHTRLNLFWR